MIWFKAHTVAPTHMMLTAHMMMTIKSQGHRDHHRYHMTIHMLTFPLQMLVRTPWKRIMKMVGCQIVRVVGTVRKCPAGVLSTGVRVGGEVGIMSCGAQGGEDLVKPTSRPNERSIRLRVSRFRWLRGWSNVHQGMDKLGMRSHLIHWLNQLRVPGLLLGRTISKVTAKISSSHTSIPGSQLCLDLTCRPRQGPWLHGLLRLVKTTCFLHSNGLICGRCMAALALKVRGIRIDRCSPSSAKHRVEFIQSLGSASEYSERCSGCVTRISSDSMIGAQLT